MNLERKKFELEQQRYVTSTDNEVRRLDLEAQKVALERAPSKKYLGPAVVLAAAIIAAVSSFTQLELARRAKDQDDARAAKERLEKDHRELARFMIDKQGEIFREGNMPRTKALLEAFYPEVVSPILSKLSQTLPSTSERQAFAEPNQAASTPAVETWKIHLNWALQDSGGVDCPQEYAEVSQCLFGGRRSCVMREAQNKARSGDAAGALRLSLITQCHNLGAQGELRAAGASSVSGYLASLK